MNRRKFMGTAVAGSFLEHVGLGQPASAGSINGKVERISNLTVEPTEDDVVLEHLVYAHLLDPREHPDYARRYVRPPNWNTFGDRTRFTTLRGFNIKDDRIVGYVDTIEKYTQKYGLGDVLWPFCSTVFANNLGDLAEEIKRRNLFLFDIWGYVPGSAAREFSWGEFRPPAGALGLLQSTLGERWLGMDNGEQDGRYIGGYAPEMYPSSADRLEQYLNFQRYFERLTDELGNKMAALVSLNFGHYLLKEGVYTLLGAETAQALPNAQIFYVFIRGAGKQYGVPWFGNSSVFNRWGYKAYGSEGRDHGPTRGTSLSLMKRLMYSHILYNSMLVGFENGWFYDNQVSSRSGWKGSSGDGKLTPIGHIQRAARRWVDEVGQPGVMVAPIALMLDFYAGWTFPRHLYTEDVYRIWGNLPYGPADYLADGVLDMLYPGYQNSSYFHDESGFLCPTPYGDAADCILSDAEGWLLTRYPMLVVAGGLGGGTEIRDKFEAYVEQGGHLLITAGNLAKLPAGLAGIQVAGPLKHFEARQRLQVGATKVEEDDPFDLYPLAFPKAAHLLAESAGLPAVMEMAYGKGRITVLSSPFGVGAKEKTGVGMALASELRNEVDKPLAKPYPLLKHVRAALDQAFRTQMLFEAGEGLSLITCRKGPGEYTLGIANSFWNEQPLKIIAHCGGIKSIREIPLDQSEKGAVGYVPEGLEKANLGVSGENSIAGGDIRIFAVQVGEENIEEIPHRAPQPRPRGRFLPLRSARVIKEGVLARPTFFEHFDGVVVDWRYLERRGKNDLEQEAGWIGRQKLRVLVDLTSGINLYPDLRLIDNIPADYSASVARIERVMTQMDTIHSQDLILSLHRFPENNFTRDQTWSSFEVTLRCLAQEARTRGITLYLRMALRKPPQDLKEAVWFLGRVGASNLRLAPCTALILAKQENFQEAATLLVDHVGLWMMSAPGRDVAGVLTNTNTPIAAPAVDTELLAKTLALAPHAPIVFDAVYNCPDEEYLDVRALDNLIARVRSRMGG